MCCTNFWLSIITTCASLIVVYSSAQETLNLKNVEENGELVFAQVFYGHGDRNPILQCPGDNYNLSHWPEGWGQLTILGKQQHFALGKWLRRRYKNFISTAYNFNETYIQSSDVDRTLMSAQVNLAGFYPPKEIWSYNLLWQPIPIHTIPVKMDYLITGSVPSCPSYKKEYQIYMQSDEMKAFTKEMQPIFDYLTRNTGQVINDYFNLTVIYDSWNCETIHKLPLPTWSKVLYPNNEQFYRAALKFYFLPTATRFLSKFSVGFFLKDMLDRFTSKIQKTLKPDRKLWIYSTHDTTLFNFLNSLNITDNKFVPYAATIMLELRRFKDEDYVQIFYKNTAKIPVAIDIPGCGIACPLSKMYELYDDILPKKDFAAECKITK